MSETRQAGRRFQVLWHVHPARALAEAGVLGLLVLFLLSRVVGHAPPALFGNGTLMLCGACGMWVVLRTRVPRMHPALQVLWELAVGVALSTVMAVGLRLSTDLLGWSAIWEQSDLGNVLTTALLALTGLGYLVARAGVRVWLYWDRVRRRRMVFSLTHAHLSVALVVMVLFVLLMALGMVGSGDLEFLEPEGGGLATLVADRIFLTIVPLVSVSVVMMLLVLAVLLPPSALFSYLVARRTTRRLAALAETARAMRQGDYGARVEQQGQDEVAQLQSDFNAMAERLEQTLHDLQAQRDTIASLLDSRRELLASVSHELRTPVATVRAMVESMLTRHQAPLPASMVHDLELIEGEVLRLQRLIDDLFALARAEVDALALDCRPIDVTPVVRRMVDAMAPLAWESGRVEVVAELPERALVACVDEARLEQILANLLRNGLQHTLPGGIVVAVVDTERDSVRIRVRDTGEGISPRDLPHIWERFYRGERARADGGRGAGLGLAVVKELTEAMGGTVTAESIVGEGSCFAVRLPAA